MKQNVINPLAFIKAIRDSQPELQVAIFTQGSCYKFYEILKIIYPHAIPYHDSNHIITKIGNKFYDITGEVSKGKYLPFSQSTNSSKEHFKTYYYNKDKEDEYRKQIEIADKISLMKSLEALEYN